ncbi:MAG: aminotransferase class III-fold pyridoxal phosphate-dependent enzyme, partial [Proteobacteria bacterium]|nr:aminotransferase class III-fold pyridoxal phosphate-dependent enzyme [Pseudomonadota bacterium]
MLAEFVLDWETREPAPQETLQIVREGVKRGLVLIRAGLYSNCVRLLPPLVITDAQLDEGLAALGEAVRVVEAGRTAAGRS